MKKQYKRREIIKNGSQTSEPIELTDYAIMNTNEDGDYILRDEKTGKREVWVHNQDFAGYCVRIGNKNYEFARSL